MWTKKKKKKSSWYDKERRRVVPLQGGGSLGWENMLRICCWYFVPTVVMPKISEGNGETWLINWAKHGGNDMPLT